MNFAKTDLTKEAEVNSHDIIAVASIGLASVLGCNSGENEYVEPPPPAVSIAPAIVQDVTLFAEDTGQLEAAEVAEVRSRVRGFVEEIQFEPGALVKQGDILYEIERDEYEAAQTAAASAVAAADAAILVAKAEVEKTNARVEQTKRDFQRQEQLIERQSTSQAEYDAALAARDAALAAVESAQAAVAAAEAEKKIAFANQLQAELDLRYTSVSAPISGRITKTDVKLGNLVEDGALLATIVDDSRIFANFSASDRELLRYLDRMKERDGSVDPGNIQDWKRFQVYLRRETDQDFRFAGHLDYIDQQGVDSATGTVAMRAVFDNPERELVPGLFVYLRLPVSQQSSALLVPEHVVQRDPRGSYVLVVDSENTVQRQEVEPGAARDGWVIVASGISAEDLIVIDGLQRARPGSAINPERVELDASDVSFSVDRLNSPEADRKDISAESE